MTPTQEDVARSLRWRLAVTEELLKRSEKARIAAEERGARMALEAAVAAVDEGIDCDGIIASDIARPTPQQSLEDRVMSEQTLIEAMARALEPFVFNKYDYENAATAALAALRETHHLVPKDQEPDATGRIMLEMAKASDVDAMWEKRWLALRSLNYHNTNFADQHGRWTLADFINYAGEVCGYAPEKRHDV